MQAARLLLEKFAPDAADIINQRELLHIAAEGNHVSMIRLFLEHGADIDLDTGGTPAAAAASLSKREALCELLDRGAITLSLPTTNSQTSLLHEITGYASSPHEAESTMALVCEKYVELFSKIVDNYDNRGLTALHEAIVWANLKIVALLIQRLHASAIPVRGTALSPTTLANLSRKHPPWHIEQQGKKGLELHERHISTVLSYLVESCCMDPPDDNVTEHSILRHFLTPNPSHWSESDQLWDWHIKIQ